MNIPQLPQNNQPEISTLQVSVEVLPHAVDLPLPKYETASAAGMDLRAALSSPITLQPLERTAVPTGLRISIPVGFEAQVRPRSGLALRQGLSMVNTPGTIDADYRGEVQVLMINLGQEPATINHGDRIAQIIFAPVIQATWVQVSELDETERAEGGFGHTGVQ